MTEVLTGADFKALREKYKATPTEWAELLNIQRTAVYKLEAMEALTVCWTIVYLYIQEHGLGVLYAEKKKRA